MNKHNFQVTVNTRYLNEQSQPEKSRFVHAYDIVISNIGSETAQLISRKWHIIDANNEVQEVQGMGVIGEQPTLEPGQSYSYTSGVVIATDTGTMTGSYTMRTPEGEEFETDIPMFALVKPSALH